MLVTMLAMLKTIFKIIEQQLYLPLFKKRNGAHSGNLVCWSHKMAFLWKTTKILGKKKCNLLKNINELAKI